MLWNPTNPNLKAIATTSAPTIGLSFASMSTKIAEAPGNGPYVFQVQSQVYHRISHLNLPDGQPQKFAQLYVIDSTTQRLMNKGYA